MYQENLAEPSSCKETTSTSCQRQPHHALFQLCPFEDLQTVTCVTGTDIIEVPAVGREIIKAMKISSITPKINRACQFGNIVGCNWDLVASRDVIFRTDMHKAKQEWWESRYRVIVMSCSEVATFVLIRDIIAYVGATNSWLTVSV